MQNFMFLYLLGEKNNNFPVAQSMAAPVSATESYHHTPTSPPLTTQSRLGRNTEDTLFECARISALYHLDDLSNIILSDLLLCVHSFECQFCVSQSCFVFYFNGILTLWMCKFCEHLLREKKISFIECHPKYKITIIES